MGRKGKRRGNSTSDTAPHHGRSNELADQVAVCSDRTEESLKNVERRRTFCMHALSLTLILLRAYHAT